MKPTPVHAYMARDTGPHIAIIEEGAKRRRGRNKGVRSLRQEERKREFVRYLVMHVYRCITQPDWLI